MKSKLKIFTDGGARGNPGPAAVGIAIYDEDEIILKHSEYIGETTNNYAEYQAVVRALELVKKFKPDEIIFYLDSELVVQQLNQKYKIKNNDLGKLFIKIWNARQIYKKVNFIHIRREENKIADLLVNEALDKNKQ